MGHSGTVHEGKEHEKSVKISKKTGIALFVTAAVIMALLIVFHKNPGPAVDQSQELAKRSSPALSLRRHALRLSTGTINLPDCR